MPSRPGTQANAVSLDDSETVIRAQVQSALRDILTSQQQQDVAVALERGSDHRMKIKLSSTNLPRQITAMQLHALKTMFPGTRFGTVMRDGSLTLEEDRAPARSEYLEFMQDLNRRSVDTKVRVRDTPEDSCKTINADDFVNSPRGRHERNALEPARQMQKLLGLSMLQAPGLPQDTYEIPFALSVMEKLNEVAPFLVPRCGIDKTGHPINLARLIRLTKTLPLPYEVQFEIEEDFDVDDLPLDERITPGWRLTDSAALSLTCGQPWLHKVLQSADMLARMKLLPNSLGNELLAQDWSKVQQQIAEGNPQGMATVMNMQFTKKHFPSLTERLYDLLAIFLGHPDLFTGRLAYEQLTRSHSPSGACFSIITVPLEPCKVKFIIADDPAKDHDYIGCGFAY